MLVVGISQSGESTDTNAVLEDARRRGAVTVGITNEAGTAGWREIAEHTLLARAGREESVAATKTYTCQLLALYLLAHALGRRRQRWMCCATLPGWVESVLDLEERVGEIAERYTFMSRAVTVGRGLNYANALEFGLKLMETCYVVAERFSSADLMHGPDRAGGALLSGLRVRARRSDVAIHGDGARPVGGVARRDAGLHRRKQHGSLRQAGAADSASAAQPGCGGPHDLYTPIPYIVPAQLFAAHLAAIKGLNPDRPRTLHKITRTM